MSNKFSADAFDRVRRHKAETVSEVDSPEPRVVSTLVQPALNATFAGKIHLWSFGLDRFGACQGVLPVTHMYAPGGTHKRLADQV
ncbi:hypothetical protein [Saccharopolyspora pogona]|uniref:hypothetical protein n=1 Tax=Saccharopolyspora pogona TaxID=333966 RepID=UPI0016843CAA|nr:hypothetical protein [Saccharopolyspora pogona]